MPSRLGIIFAGLYVLGVFTTWIYVFAVSRDIEAVSIYSFLLGLPWSAIFVILLELIKMRSETVVAVCSLLSIGLNTMLLYIASNRFMQRLRLSNDRFSKAPPDR